MSQAPTSPSPPARTCPSIAAITGNGSFRIAAQQVGQFTGAVDGEVTGIAAHGLGQIGSGTERSAGVVQHHRAHTGLLGGVGQTLAQLVDQFGGQRVAVVRRIQRQASDTALDGVMDQ